MKTLNVNISVKFSKISFVFLTPTILPKSEPSIIPEEAFSFLEYCKRHNSTKNTEDNKSDRQQKGAYSHMEEVHKGI